MDAFTTDPLAASGYVHAVAARVRAFDAALGSGPVALDPFRGETTIGKTSRESVLASRDFEPIKGPLIAHLDYLLERRINLGVSLEESALSTQALHPATAPFPQPSTLSARRLTALRAATEPARLEEARLAFRTLERDVRPVSAVRVLRYERLLEIEERLGTRLSPAVVLREDGDDVPAAAAERESADETAIERLARQLLAETRDAAAALLEPGFAGVVGGATGTPATEGWPARLAADTLLSLFGGSWLLAGEAPSALGLPGRLCPASFPRAAVQLGRELVRAGTPKWLPFVLARTPNELYGRVIGRRLGLWLLSPACARRALGLGAEGRERHARGAARLLLAETRLLCARALLAEAGHRSRRRLEEVWDELGVELCGGTWGPPLGLLRAQPDAAVDLVAQLWALAQEAESLQAFDEDYLDNPRARDALLSEMHAAEPPPPSVPVLRAAGHALVRRLSVG